MAQVRIMHYLNQFFAGVGGEDKADVPVDFRDGSMGPGKRLQALLGDSTKIVVTAYCGDNYFAENYDKAVADIVQIAKDFNAQMVIAGPAFASGRYGFACVEVCHSLSTSLDLYGVAGLNIENPGIEIYQQYKDKRVFVLPAAKEIRGMEDALLMMAKFVSKLASGSATGSASEEGYIPRGIRVPATASKPGKTRAVEMLLNKLAGRPFETEIPIASLEQIPVTLGITNLQDASLVLISEGGVIPLGNPDEFKVLRNTRWGKYSIEGLDSMQDATWDVIHGGYDTEFMRNNPNYGVPLDVCRQLEREGRFAKLHPYFYGTSGSNASILAMQTIGRELVADIKTEHIDAALLVSTWGSGTRSGAVIAREIERAGIPTVQITAMSMLAKQLGANRVVTGNRIIHPLGDPSLSAEADLVLRREIVSCALSALETDIESPTIFSPNVITASG